MPMHMIIKTKDTVTIMAIVTAILTGMTTVTATPKEVIPTTTNISAPEREAMATGNTATIASKKTASPKKRKKEARGIIRGTISI